MTSRLLRVLVPAFALCLVAAAPQARAQQDAFPLRNGDTWVMVGDSITAQHLHTNYFEAFCFARFPNLTFRFRNSGVSGDRIPTALDRWQYDVARWHPAVVSVELGMNDAGAGPASVSQYIENMGSMVKQIRALNARPVVLSPSPVNDGTSAEQWRRDPNLRNSVLDLYASALLQFTHHEQLPYADQFHLLAPDWGRNTALWNAASGAEEAISYPSTPNVDQLRQWLAAFRNSGVRIVNLLGDPVHPGPPGQLMMAAALLKELRAPGLVSEATLDAGTGSVVSARQCSITGARASGATLTFSRADQSLPFPIPDAARPALAITPLVNGMSQLMLTIRGLPAGNYDVKIDDVAVATVTDADLKQGWNGGLLDRGPIADQGRAILRAVDAKEALVGRWRGISTATAHQPDADVAVRLAAVERDILEADGRIRAAAHSKPHRWSIAPVARAGGG